MTEKIQRRQFILVGGSLAVSVLSAGCGGGGGSSSSAPSPTLPPPEPPPPPEVTDPPSVAVNPVDQLVEPGEIAMFSVEVQGSNLAFQWQRDGVDIGGATGMSYASAPVEFADHGAVFAAVVTNSAGSVTSDPAVLSVVFNQLITADDVLISVDSVTIRVDDVQA